MHWLWTLIVILVLGLVAYIEYRKHKARVDADAKALVNSIKGELTEAEQFAKDEVNRVKSKFTR